MVKLSDYLKPDLIDHGYKRGTFALRSIPVYHKEQAAVISGIRGYIAGVKIAAWFLRIIRRIKR